MATALGAASEFHHTQRRPDRLGWLLVAPMLVWLLAFVVVPSGILLVYSFCERDELGDVVFSLTLDNYKRIFVATEFQEDGSEITVASEYLGVLWRSVVYAGITTIVCVVTGYPVAYFVGKSPEAWRNRLLLLIMIPFWTSFLVRVYAWISILRSQGLVNAILQYTHIITEPLDILYTPAAVIIGLVYMYLPFMILPIYGSVEKLDDSLIEAAMDLGARPLTAFRRVILPLTWPGVGAGIMLVFVPTIGMFAITDLLGGGKVPMIGNIIQNQFTGLGHNPPLGAALGISMLVLFVAAYWGIRWMSAHLGSASPAPATKSAEAQQELPIPELSPAVEPEVLGARG